MTWKSYNKVSRLDKHKMPMNGVEMLREAKKSSRTAVKKVWNKIDTNFKCFQKTLYLL